MASAAPLLFLVNDISTHECERNLKAFVDGWRNKFAIRRLSALLLQQRPRLHVLDYKYPYSRLLWNDCDCLCWACLSA